VIYGASGGVGIFALQIARALGAEVTAVCSAGKMEQARALGAHRVIDYAADDFDRGGQRYDVIIAVNGYIPIRRYRDALLPGGRYVMVGGKGKQMAEAMFLGPFLGADGKTLRVLTARPETERIELLSRMVDEGKLRTVIDRVYPLEETAQAIRHLEAGHAKGKIVIRVAG
jgi:NADPH:quinone reductase-like Zn-dependent oxidoreductase